MFHSPISGKYSCHPVYGPLEFRTVIAVGSDEDDEFWDELDELLDGINNETARCLGPVSRFALNRCRMRKKLFPDVVRLFGAFRFGFGFSDIFIHLYHSTFQWKLKKKIFFKEKLFTFRASALGINI